jgi:hypothetical protein
MCVPLDTPEVDAGADAAGFVDAGPADAKVDGGACPSTPTLLYEISAPTRMAVNGTHVALLLPTAALLVPRGAGAVGTRPATAPNGIAVDATHAYFTDGPVLRAVDLANVNADSPLYTATAGSLGAVAADATGVYFVHDEVNGMELRDLGGVIASTTGSSPGEGLALAKTNIIVTRGNGVFAVPRGTRGGDLSLMSLYTRSTAPRHICADGDRLFWNELASVNVDQILAATPFGIAALPVSIIGLIDFTCASGSFYWTVGSPASLVRDDVAGAVTTLDSVTKIGPVVSDGTCLFYWAASPRGAGVFWSNL